MKKVQRFLACCLSLCLVLTMLPMSAFAEEADPVDDVLVTADAAEAEDSTGTGDPADPEDPQPDADPEAPEGTDALRAAAASDLSGTKEKQSLQANSVNTVNAVSDAAAEPALTADTGALVQATAELGKGSAVAGTDYTVTSRKNYSIAPDIKESIIVTNNAAGNSQTVANVMEINLANGYAHLVAGYGHRNPKDEGWTLDTTTNQAHLYENVSGANVVGGVNASYFNINTGEPIGVLAMDGVVYKNDVSRPYIAMFSDGSVGFFTSNTSLASAAQKQSEKQGKEVTLTDAIAGWVVLIDGEYVATSGSEAGPYSRTAVGVKEDGTIVLVQADGTMAPRSVGYTIYELGSLMKSLGCVYAIELDSGGSATYVSQREGESDVTMRNNPAGGTERVISTSILVVSTAPSDGEFDHAVITPNSEYYTPNSSVALEATGMDYSGALSGGIPATATWVFAEGSEGMGELTAGSISGNTASATFVSNGTLGDAVINLIDGGKVVGSVTVHIQVPDSLAFTSDEINLNYSQESDLGLVAKYQGEVVNLKDGDIVWTISDETAGAFQGNTFVVTSDKKVSVSAQITASYGELTDTITANVGKQPTMILDGGDEDGWDYSNIGTTVGSFDGMAENAVATYSYGRGGIVKGSVVSDTDEEYADIVRFGHNAIRLDYDWTGVTGTEGACLGLGSYIDVPGTPTAIGVWVYIPEGVPVPWLRAQIATSNNGGATYANAYINFTEEKGNEGLKTGWQYLEADLTQYSGTKIRVNSGMLFRAMAGASQGFGWYTVDNVALDKSQLKGYIIIDNISIVYGANNQDVTNPVVTAVQLINEDGTKSDLENGAVLSSDTLNFFASYHDAEETDEFATGVESAYFYLDGIFYGEGTKDNLGSTLAGITMADGEHSLTFYLKDGYGNVTRETRYFTVNSGSSRTGVSLEIPAAPSVGSTWELNLNTNNIADLATLETTVTLSRGYEVTGVEFAEGVTGTYTFNASKGTVVITITGVNGASGSRLATIRVFIPASAAEGVSISAQVSKGSYTTVGSGEYWKGFSTAPVSYRVGAAYRVAAGDLVVSLPAQLTVTDLDGNTAAGVTVYYGADTVVGTTDAQGCVSADVLTITPGTYTVYAMDAEGGRSYPIQVTSYVATGDEDGTPYYVIHNVAKDPTTQQNISWMSNPLYAAADAQVKLSASQDMSDAWVVEGQSSVVSYSSSGLANLANRVVLTGLTPGTTYYYQVGDGTKWSDVRSFTTTKAGDEQTDFFIMADIQEEEALTGFQNIVKNLEGTEFDFGLQTGDAVDNVRFYDQWENALDLFTMDGIAQYDMIHVIGNHEADDGGKDAVAAKSIFNIEADWYSVEYGNVYVAVLNHTMDKDKLAQFKSWLVEDAAKSQCEWKILTTHVPVYYTNPTGGGQEYLQALPEAIEAAGIDFFFAGNDHSYARTAPLTGGNVDEKDGVVYYICGSTGGKSYSAVVNPDFHFEKATIDFDSVYMTVSAGSESITVTTYNVDTNGNATVYDTYTKEKYRCPNEEHDYRFDRKTNMLTCAVCGYECNAVDDKYSGFAREAESGRMMYFVVGQYSTGYLRVENRDYNFDDVGLGYEGTYTLCGEKCTFVDGMFSSSENSEVWTAGRCGATTNFVLYKDCNLYVGGIGETSTTGITGVPWQGYRGKITKVTIGREITVLSDYLFYDCDALTEVVFEEGSKLHTIGGAVFFSCGWLPEVTLPDGVTTIYGNTFAKCDRLTAVYLPDSVSYMSSSVYTNSPNVVLSVAPDSYAKNYAVKYGIKYKERIIEEVAQGSCGANLTWTFTSDGVLTISGTGPMTNYKSADAVPWYSYQSAIKTVNIGAGVTSLSDYAFYYAKKLTQVNFDENSKMQMLGGSVFYKCTGLKNITLPDGVTTIYGNTFAKCDNLVSVYLPDSVSYMSSSAFNNSPKVVLSVGYESYAKGYAEKNGIQYVERQNQTIGEGKCGDSLTWKLTSEGVLTISGAGPMTNYKSADAVPWYSYQSMIQTVNIGADVTSLSDYAFYYARNLTKVTFAEGSKLQELGGSVFYRCTSLKKITLPEGLKTIYGNTFAKCDSLTSVYLPDSVAYMSSSVFNGSTQVVLSVGYESYAKSYAQQHSIRYEERKLDTIGEGKCGTGLTWKLTSDGVLTISGSGKMTAYQSADAVPWYSYQSVIKTVNVGAGVTSLSDYAFYYAKSLTQVNFAAGSKLQEIGGSVFYRCASLKAVTLPEGLKTIYGNSFAKCESLTSVYVPNSVSYMSSSVFAHSAKVVLSVGSGSYAQSYAQANGITYTVRG